MRFWLGAKKLANGSFQWNDGELIPNASKDGFPNWADGRPTNQSGYSYLMVSTDNELRKDFFPLVHSDLVTDANEAYLNATTSIFYWIDATADDVAGFICEKRSELKSFQSKGNITLETKLNINHGIKLFEQCQN